MVQNRWFAPGTLPYFLSSQFFYSSLPVPPSSFNGQTVIITGANTGIGFEAAKHIARMGVSKLILAVRCTAKGSKAKQLIEESTRCKKGIVEIWPLDLGSTRSVRQFAHRVNRDLKRVDVLIENAGIATQSFCSLEGEEATIKTNVLSTFLLAFLMLPKLKETAQISRHPPVLTIVSSEVHYWTSFSEGRDAAPGRIFDDLSREDKADMSQRYSVSKLLEVFIVRKLAALRTNHVVSRDAKRDYPVTINLVNPGLCHSDLLRELPLWSPIRILKLFLARTTEEGSRMLVHAASSGPGSHGKYLTDMDVERPSRLVLSPEGKSLGDRVFKELCERLEWQVPGCVGNL